MEFRYEALQICQTKKNKLMVLFAAPASEINKWAGIPQKKRFGTDEETVGFQREENPKRVKSLGEFFANDENIIQNPLLCATRQIQSAQTRFEPKAGGSGDTLQGELIIEMPDFEAYSLIEIFGYVRKYIEGRVPELSGTAPDADLVTKLKDLAATKGHLPAPKPESELTEGEHKDGEAPDGILEDDAEIVSALFEESHILDFWQEVAARHEVIQLIETEKPRDEFLSFTRTALLSYLCPVVLVDGQHRLRGALKAVENTMVQQRVLSEIESRIGKGEKAAAVSEDIIKREVRRLPISLLLSDDPGEQVFQFVVVNQKATPVGKALLGTIVATTLSNDEMQKVASRLRNAGIELEESRAITYLARLPTSPFFGLVERGFAGDSMDLLQWNVFSSLITIFRELKGGKLYGFKNDFSEAWRSRVLETSKIVANFAEKGYTDAFSYWGNVDDGPWRDVFIKFFDKIRAKFGDISTKDAPNYWGRPRQSNLFNKISLTILSADFFQFLSVNKIAIDSADAVPDLVEKWLDGVSGKYFNRNWDLSGTKKDSSGIRNQWAFQWSEYRQNPVQLPQTKMYRLTKT